MHKITEFVLRRPVTTFLAVLSLVFFGFMSLVNQKMELMSSIDMPMMIITTVYPGASPEDVDKLITGPIEDAVSILSHVKDVQSTSSENMGMTLVQYEYGTDMDQAYDDLKKKMDSVKSSLPKEAEAPNYLSMNINEQPCITLSINNPMQDNLYNYVQNDIVPELEKVSGVASVSSSGGQKQYIKVELIPEKLKQYKLSMQTIAQTVQAAKFTYPAGNTNYGSQKLSVSSSVDYENVQDLQNMPIITGTGDTIYLKDIAVVDMSQEEKSSIGRYNGQDTISLSITKNQNESAVTVSRRIKAQIEALKQRDSHLEVITIEDDADNIISSLKSVFETMIMAVIISMIIIFIFFGDWKASLIVGTSIPLSILAALVAMWAMGYSLNMITMSALVLGVGMMVDNSIVVLEACFRAMDNFRDVNSQSRRGAALESVKTVGESVLGSTITTCVVFVPLSFMKGLSGQFFAPLGFTIVFCMLSSLLSAISIVPICYVLYKPKENTKAPAYNTISRLQEWYRGTMDRLLNHKKLVMFTSVAMLVLSLFLATKVRVEMMPQTDEGTVSISIKMRPGLRIEKKNEIMEKVEQLVAADPDTKNYTASAGSDDLSATFYGNGGSASVNVNLKKDRSMKTKDVATKWRKALDGTPDAVISVTSSGMMSSMSTSKDTFQTNLTATDLNKLKKASDEIVELLQARKDVTAVHSSLENAAPLIKFSVDPIRAAAEGFSPVQVGQQLNQMMTGSKAMKMQVDGQDVDVTVEYPRDEFDDLRKVEDILLTTPAGKQVRVADLCDVRFADSPSGISRKNKRYQASITADFTTEANAGSYNEIQNNVIKPALRDGVEISRLSSDAQMMEEFQSLGTAIAIAVFLIWVVMAAQFESMRFSFMVMTTLPFGMIGSFLFLWLFDSTISMPSLLGFLMLIGTVVNNGILYVDTVNQYRMGMPLRRALIEAGATRLRPILMTTLTTVVSMVPMAVGFGDNGAMMQGLALVDVGGLTASTILALLMLPIYYSIMDKKKKNVQRDIPDAGYMQGKDPRQYYQQQAAEEWARYNQVDEDPS